MSYKPCKLQTLLSTLVLISTSCSDPEIKTPTIKSNCNDFTEDHREDSDSDEVFDECGERIDGGNEQNQNDNSPN